MRAYSVIVLTFFLSIMSTSLKAQTFTCSANCGSVESFSEKVFSSPYGYAQAYQGLVSSCSRTLFTGARALGPYSFHYELASVVNSCVRDEIVSTCTCSANCGSADGYREVIGSGSSRALAYQDLLYSCRQSILFVQAIPNNNSIYDYDYVFAGVQNACVCQ